MYYKKLSVRRPTVLSWCGSKDEIQAFVRYRATLNVSFESSPTQSGKGRRNIKAVREGDKDSDNAKEKREKQVERVAKRRLEQLERNGTGGVMINLGHDSRVRDVWVSDFIAASLKPHQIKGIQFIWTNLITLFNTDKRQKKSGTGCILAHSMVFSLS